MSIYSDIVTVLDADAGVGAICGDRIYPLLKEQGAELPNIVIDVLDTDFPDSTIGAAPSLVNHIVEIRCYSDVLATCRSLADAARAAITGSSIRAILDSEEDDYIFDEAQYVVSTTYSMWSYN